MTKCPDKEDVLAALDSARDPGSEEILAHIAACARCTEYAAEIRRWRDDLSRYTAANAPRATGGCPEDEDLLAYAAGALEGPEERRVKKHLDLCETCLLWVAEVRRAMAAAEPCSVRTPKVLLARGKQIGVPAPREQVPVPAVQLARADIAPATAGGAVRRLRVPRFRLPRLSWVSLSYVGACGAAACVLFLLTLPHHDAASIKGIGTKPAKVITVPGSDAATELGGPTPAPLPGLDALSFWYRIQGPGQLVEVPMPSDRRIALTSRDEYGLRFRTSQEGWAYVFQVDSGGHLSQLFPVEEAATASSRVAAGQEYRLPGAGKAFQLDNEAGEETIYIVFAHERHTDWEDALRAKQGAGVNDGQARVISDLRALAAEREAYAIKIEHESAAPR